MKIIFKEKLIKIGDTKLIRVPLASSKSFASRGMVMGKVIIKNFEFIAPLEPDGKGSHWIEINQPTFDELKIQVDDNVDVNIEPIDEWIKPEMPEDLTQAIRHNDLINQWNSITIKAKWDWIRWIRSTENIGTRNKRINVACSKLLNGDKNPCCFDRNRCTITDVSKSGVLLD